MASAADEYKKSITMVDGLYCMSMESTTQYLLSFQRAGAPNQRPNEGSSLMLRLSHITTHSTSNAQPLFWEKLFSKSDIEALRATLSNSNMSWSTYFDYLKCSIMEDNFTVHVDKRDQEATVDLWYRPEDEDESYNFSFILPPKKGTGVATAASSSSSQQAYSLSLSMDPVNSSNGSAKSAKVDNPAAEMLFQMMVRLRQAEKKVREAEDEARHWHGMYEADQRHHADSSGPMFVGDRSKPKGVQKPKKRAAGTSLVNPNQKVHMPKRNKIVDDDAEEDSLLN